MVEYHGAHHLGSRVEAQCMRRDSVYLVHQEGQVLELKKKKNAVFLLPALYIRIKLMLTPSSSEESMTVQGHLILPGRQRPLKISSSKL